MSNIKKKYGVRISVLEYGYYEVEAESKDFEITDSTAKEV